jgi:hypothetical protein
MDPPIKGDWTWTTAKNLEFVPKEDWGVGTEYKVTFDKSLFPDHVLLDTYSYEFSSAPFRIRLEDTEFYTDPNDPKVKKVIVTLSASHPFDEQSLREHISMQKKEKSKGTFKLGDKKIPFSLTFDSFKGKAFIHSEIIEIPMEEYFIVTTIDKGTKSSRGGEGTDEARQSEQRVAGMYDFFRISSVSTTYVRNEKFEPEQVIVVETTARARMQDVLKKLSVHLLPVDRPKIGALKKQKNHYWSQTNEIGPEVLKASSLVKLDPQPLVEEYNQLFSFKIDVPIGRYLYIKIDKGIKSFGDYVLAKHFDAIRHVQELPKELTFMSKGAVLSLSGSHKLSVLARDLDAIEFEVGRVLPKDVNHLASQTSGQFDNPYFQSHTFRKENLTELFTEVRPLKYAGKGKAQYTSFDLTNYLYSHQGKRGLFFLSARNYNPKTESAMLPDDHRFILVTDLGMVTKRSIDGAIDVFVASIASGQPVSDARVQVLGLNGLPIYTASTNARGHVFIPPLKDFNNDKKPSVFVVTKGDDLSFLPYERYDRKLSYSRFDVGGEHSSDAQGKLQSYLFSDRGIYRPGDNFNVGIIVKPADWQTPIANVPLEVVINDPRGMTVKRHKISLNEEGFVETSYKTLDSSPTGDYEVHLYIVRDAQKNIRDWLGSTSVRVEEFVPDKMKIKASLSKLKADGWVHPVELKGLVNLKNLFGTPATDRRVTGKIRLVPWYPSPRGYSDYQFADPNKAKMSYNEPLAEQKTNENGEAEFDLDLGRFQTATYRLTFFAEGFEAGGGRAVNSSASILVSPNNFLVGYKKDGDLNYINKNSERSVDLIAISPGLNKMDVKDLTAKLIELKYVSVLTKQSSGVYKYQSMRKEVNVSEEALTIPEAGKSYRLPTATPGNFAIIIESKGGKELNRIEYAVIGSANLSRNLEKNAELELKLNQTDYAPGDTIEMEIKAPYVGSGLITIERDKVYAYKWFKTDSTTSMQTITMPEGLEGNGYVNVAFVRDINSKEIYTSPLSYGVQPFSVSRARRINQINMQVPELVKPGEELKITYSTQKPSKIVLFAVDEGILQVAKYQTPNPLASFFKKKALQVHTWQILDQIIPEFEILKELSAPGGGEGAGAPGNLNPFKRKSQKPVAYWSTIVDATPSPQSVSYRVPDYFNGSIRVMAVAVADDSIGVTSQNTIARGPFVISPTAPFFVAPGDEFSVGVSIANNVEESGLDAPVKVDLSTSTHLEIVGDKVQTVNISAGREKTVTFKMKALKNLGAGTLKFTAGINNGPQASYSMELSVRPPSPYRVLVQGAVVKDDKGEIATKRTMYEEYGSKTSSVSALPIGYAKGLLQYLKKYPYGCVEQVISRAFPIVSIGVDKEFDFNGGFVSDSVDEALRIMRSRQNAEGGYGYWTASSDVSQFATVYGAHFLTEAAEQNHFVDRDVLQKNLLYLVEMLKFVPEQLGDARLHAYAIYLLSRNGIVTTNQIDGLLAHLKKRFDESWKKDLTAAYLGASLKLLQQNAAKSMFGGVKFSSKDFKEYDYFHDSLIHDGMLLYLTARHFPERIDKVSQKDLERLTSPIKNGAFNTLSSATSILGLKAYSDLLGPKALQGFKLAQVLPGDKTAPVPLPENLTMPTVPLDLKATKVTFENPGDTYAFVQTTESGFDVAVPDSIEKNSLEIQREYQNESGSVVTKATVGEKLKVHVKIRGLGESQYSYIAMIDLLPAGFEVELGRGATRSIADSKTTWGTEHTDLREDRVLAFGTITGDVQEFVYTIRATNAGDYVIPPVYAESMYDRSVWAMGKGGRMTVKEAP